MKVIKLSVLIASICVCLAAGAFILATAPLMWNYGLPGRAMLIATTSAILASALGLSFLILDCAKNRE